MKVAAVVLAFLGAVMAQDYDSLPACGKTCISNLLGDSSAFGCGSGSDQANCLCSEPNFSYGIRDCSNESCGDSGAASSVINYGISYCSSAGVAIPTTVQTVTSGASSATGTGSATATGSSATGGGAAGSAISTTSFLTTVTTDGSTITTSAASTIFSSGSGVASSLSGAASSLSGAASSLSGAAGSAASSASSAASAAASSAGSAASSAASGAASGSSSSSAFAPQMTAAPVGFLAAAGVAAMLL